MADIQDFGEKIGGARKDLWRARGLRIEDLKDLTLKEYAENITKDNIWPIKDYKKFTGKMEPVCIYYMKLVRDKLKAKITLYNDDDNYNRAELYIKFISTVRKICESLVVRNDILNFVDNLKMYYTDDRGNWSREASKTQGLDSSFIQAVNLNTRQLEMLELECELQGFPETFRGDFKGIKIHKYYSGQYTIEAGNRYLTHEKFNTIEDAINYIKSGKLAEELDEKKKEKKVSTLVNVVRPQLEFIERVGPDLRNNTDVTTDNILDIFKFRGGEFGNWNTQDDRQACLNYIFDSFVDLCYIMDTSLDAVSLGFNNGQKLAIAFGSRGKGKALAHYEPARVVINLTKMKGAGSLAHEFGHALDDALGLASGARGLRTFLSENVLIKARYKNNNLSYLETLMIELIEVMLKSDETSIPDRYKESILQAKEDADSRLVSLLEKVHNTGLVGYDVTRYEIITDSIRTNFKESDLDDLYLLYYTLCDELVSNSDKYMLERDLDIINSAKKLRKPSNFYESAKKLDRGRKAAYYSSICEMFARCFEAYIEDKLHEMGLKSEYLVHSTTNACYPGLSPYPTGEERDRINDKISELLMYVKSIYCEDGPEKVFNKYKSRDSFSSYRDSIKIIKKSTDTSRDIKKDNKAKNNNNEIVDLQSFRESLLSLSGNNTSKDRKIDYMKYMTKLVVLAKTKLGYNAVGFSSGNGIEWDGNSKAYKDMDIQKVGRAILLNKSEKQSKQLEGLIEAISYRYITLKYGVSTQSSMIAEGITYMICKSIGLDVRTYCLSDKFEILAENQVQSKSYINICNNNYKEIINLLK